MRSGIRTLSVLAAGLFLGGSIRAQIGPRMVDEPWKDTPHWADTTDELLFFGRADTEDVDGSARVFYWDSRGRIKPERESTDPLFAIGYRAVTMDTSSPNPLLDGQLNDVAVALMGNLGELAEGWQLRLIGGMGTANDGHWDNTDALYGTATLDVCRPLDETSELHFGVTWDGNSSLLPDIPLPYIAWTTRPDESLLIVAGTRDIVVQWEPVKNLELKVQYAFPVDAAAEAGYAFLGGLSLFAQYAQTLDPYFIDGVENQRLFYGHNRVMVGLRWVTDYFDISIGPGYAIKSNFSTGFDLRELEKENDIDPGWFAYLRVQGTF